MKNEIANLLEKLQNAEGPNAELDGKLCILTNYIDGNDYDFTNLCTIKKDDESLLQWTDRKGFIFTAKIPNLTASIDAAMNWAKYILPTCNIKLYYESGMSYVSVFKDDIVFETMSTYTSLALCTSALTALQYMKSIESTYEPSLEKASKWLAENVLHIDYDSLIDGISITDKGFKAIYYSSFGGLKFQGSKEDVRGIIRNLEKILKENL
jgi:hypothetical protein